MLLIEVFVLLMYFLLINQDFVDTSRSYETAGKTIYNGYFTIFFCLIYLYII